MPTYEYRCAECGDFEMTQRITEDALRECPHCGGKEIQRLVSMSSFQLKGSGWYKTDYASTSSSSGSSNGTSSQDGKNGSLDSKVEKKTDSNTSGSNTSNSSPADSSSNTGSSSSSKNANA